MGISLQKKDDTKASDASNTGGGTAAAATSDGKFNIPKVVLEKYPDLVALIKETESMNDEEREYWFQVLPIMTEDQVNKFHGILENEKKQLQDLDKEYENELTKLNDKHLIEWKEFEAKERRKKLKTAESESETQEKAQEDALLTELENF